MKTNVQVKHEPVELQVNELLRLYGYNLANQSSIKSPRTKSIVNQEQEPLTCAWCQKLGVRSFTLRTDNDDSKTLCSEVCFNQYRRASFKKNKVSESDTDHNQLPIVSTIKTKVQCNNNKSAEKKNGIHKYEHQSNDINRRKILLPLRRSTPTLVTKPKSNGIARKFSSSPPSKRHRSSSSSSTSPLQLSTSSTNKKNTRTEQPVVSSPLPVSLAWQPSLVLPTGFAWPSTVDINRFQYPFFVPPLPPPPPPPPPPSTLMPSPPTIPIPSSSSTAATIPIISSDTSSSNLFTTLLKGTLSNFTCILPTFIPLPMPIPIPLCFPIQIPHTKCSVEINNQECQTVSDDIIKQKLTRRLSI